MTLPLLALDLATRTGFALGARGARPRLGTIAFTSKEHPARFRALEEWLDETAQKAGGFSEVLIEAPAPSGNFSSQSAARLLLGFAITVETWCWDHAVPYREEYVGRMRKFLLGRGTFPKGEAKPAVARWAEARGFGDETHDAYDALLAWVFGSMVPRS
jgi:hypothetical protein